MTQDAMTQDEIKALLFELIGDIAPEADPSSLSEEEDMRTALDLDSMDFNNLIIAIHERTGRNIPEADYNKLFTLKGAVAYLAGGN
jgi:acyl carrier protein